MEKLFAGPGVGDKAKEFFESPEAKHIQTQAQLADALLKTGQLLQPAVDQFKSAVIEAGGLFAKGEIWDGLKRAFTDNPLGQMTVTLMTVDKLLPLLLPGAAAAATGAGATAGAGAAVATRAFGARALGPLAVLADFLFPDEAGRGSMLEDVSPQERARGAAKAAADFDWSGKPADDRIVRVLEEIRDKVTPGGPGGAGAAPQP